MARVPGVQVIARIESSMLGRDKPEEFVDKLVEEIRSNLLRGIKEEAAVMADWSRWSHSKSCAFPLRRIYPPSK